MKIEMLILRNAKEKTRIYKKKMKELGIIKEEKERVCKKRKKRGNIKKRKKEGWY